MRFQHLISVILLLSTAAVISAQQNQPQADWLDKNAILAAEISASDIGVNSSLIDALRPVPRHLFTEEAYYEIAYENIALPGADMGFTASPSDLLRAIEMLSPETGDRILVAGSNTGYAAAALSSAAAEVYVIEESSALDSYRTIFSEYGFENVILADTADINEFSDIIAFDCIFICGAVPSVSEKLTERLSIQGNLTFILAEQGGFQQIVSLQRSLLGDTIRGGGTCYFPEIRVLKISN